MEKNTREEVRPYVDRFKALFENAPRCIHEVDSAGRLLTINRAGLSLLGARSENDVRGKSYLDFVSPQDRDRIGRLLREALRGTASEFEFSSATQF